MIDSRTAAARQDSRSKLVLFTKPVIPGRVKTRLIGDLSAAQTAALHRAFLADVLSRLAHGNFDLTIAWALQEGERIPPAAEVVGFDISVPAIRQHGSDLGQRLYTGLAETADGRPDYVAAAGSDHPELQSATVEDAFERLAAGADLVLGPVSDGGYFLIAMRRSVLVPTLFEDIDWSTERVLQQTLSQAKALDLAIELLPQGHDVDLPEDLHALAQRLNGKPESCPHTFELLRTLGMVKG